MIFPQLKLSICEALVTRTKNALNINVCCCQLQRITQEAETKLKDTSVPNYRKINV